jgi:hypothetical protein
MIADSKFDLSLIKYRDAGMSTYTYFWVNTKNQVVSPYFDSDVEAQVWIDARNKLDIK